MVPKVSTVCGLLPCSLVAGVLLAEAQTPGSPSAATALSKARPLYYTPVDGGLQGFHCEVNFDWRDFMQKAANAPIPAGDPRLAYLQAVKLSVDDDLRGQGRLDWTASGPEPDGTEDSVEKVRGGLQQLWSGFFQSWNGFFTGDLMTLDARAIVEQTAAGYHVSMGTSANLAEEQYDPKLLLENVHVATPTFDSTIVPTFAPGAQGLLVTSMRSVYRKPPGAEPTNVVMEVNYAPAGGFQLPSEVRVAVGPAAFDFHLVNCTVRSQLTAK